MPCDRVHLRAQSQSLIPDPYDADVVSDSDVVMKTFAVIMTLSNLGAILVMYGGSEFALRFM